ncbi:MAG: endonuclease III [Firmicutes bacterium]|nr:endonuclease III [Bacillota bacterium]
MKALLDKDETAEAVELILREYPEAGCALDFGSVFQLLVAVVLSAQTTDVSVNKVTPELFEKAPDPAAMAALDPKEIEEIIHSIGMYRTKAANISKLSKDLLERFDGEVPSDMEELMSLPGVGRKTANVVMAEAFGKQAIAVDTHVFRLAGRIGFADEKDAEHTELALMRVLPEEHWTELHHALIWHGRRVCSARSPRCEDCCLSGVCKRNGVEDAKKTRPSK